MRAVTPTSTKPASASCAHCGLPVPAGQSLPEETLQYCCAGCRAVATMIRGLGLEEFYRYQESAGKAVGARPPSRENFRYLDSEEFQDQLAPREADGMQCIDFFCPDIHCAACIWILEKLPNILPAVRSSRANLLSSTVSIQYSPEETQLSTIAATIASIGYKPEVLEEDAQRALEHAQRRDILLRLGVAGLAAGNTMLIAVSLYQGMFTGIEAHYRLLLQWTSALITLPALFFSARPFYSSALRSARQGFVHMDLPISIGIFIGAAASYWNTWAGADHVYFDSICMLIFLLLVGRWFQQSALQRARKKANHSSLFPPFARRLDSMGRWKDVPTSSLKPGERVKLHSEMQSPCDGIIQQGSVSMDCSFLTGESSPISLSEGQLVFAGSSCIAGSCQVEVQATGPNSRAGQLLEKTSFEKQQRAKISLFTQRIASYFLGTVLCVALITLLCSGQNFEEALERCISFLIITCPCALGLAAPLGMAFSSYAGRKKGIFIKSEEAVERAARVTTILFDKTGTLTSGTMEVIALWCTDAADTRVQLARAVASTSQHPIAKAIVRYAEQANSVLPSFPSVASRTELPGKGIAARLKDGQQLYLGSLRWCEEHLDVSRVEKDRILALRAGNQSVSILFSHEQILMVFALESSLKPDAVQTIEKLQTLGYTVGLISGDNALAVHAVARAAGISDQHVFAECLPEDKLEIVNHYGKDRVCVVGDGVNDAPAISAAGLGVGIRGGAEACLNSGDVFIADGAVSNVALLLSGARTTLHVIRRSLRISLTYNVLGGTAAVLGLVNPLVAAILMPISSTSVILNSSMSKTFSK